MHRMIRRCIRDYYLESGVIAGIYTGIVLKKFIREYVFRRVDRHQLLLRPLGGFGVCAAGEVSNLPSAPWDSVLPFYRLNCEQIRESKEVRRHVPHLVNRRRYALLYHTIPVYSRTSWSCFSHRTDKQPWISIQTRLMSWYTRNLYRQLTLDCESLSKYYNTSEETVPRMLPLTTMKSNKGELNISSSEKLYSGRGNDLGGMTSSFIACTI